jgi:hypothetical protein
MQIRIHAILSLALAGPACDVCEPPPMRPTNQDAESLALCPPLPPGVEPIADLHVAHANARFDGITLTLSTRPLACGEPAVQHGYCPSEDDRGLTLGIPGESLVPGMHALRHPIFVEFETPTASVVGGGGEVGEAQVELFEITDTCVTGRIIGLAELDGPIDGPFDGGFRAPRCTP